MTSRKFDLQFTARELRQRLSDIQFEVTQNAATERPHTGEFNAHWEKGTYTCVVCKTPLFDSETKYDPGCGWPSFYAAKVEGNVAEEFDDSLGMRRVEILCNTCGAHLGHVFPDGPRPTGMRYCVNSASLDFEPSE